MARGEHGPMTAPEPVRAVADDHPPGLSARSGVGLALASMVCVQLGLVVALGFVDQLGADGTAWLRLAWAGVLFPLLLRPHWSRYTAEALRTCVALGIVTAGITLLYMSAVTRLPLGTASALEFLGPLSISLLRGRRSERLWAVPAATGVLVLTEPWHSAVDLIGVVFALGAAACWAAYIVLTQRAGDKVSGLAALAVSMPVAALVATVVAGRDTLPRLTPELLAAGVGIALLLPVLPFSLELLALRRLTAAAFGTLMALEPAVAALVGLLALGQVPGPAAIGGIALVVAAGIGTERVGARSSQGA